MTGEQDFDSWAQYIRAAYHVKPLNGFRVFALGLDGSNPVALKVDPDGTLHTTGGGGGGGAVSTNYEYREDNPSADADKGALILGVRNDALAALTDADGDYGALAIDDRGRLLIASVNGTVTVSGILTISELPKSNSVGVTSVSASASSVTLLSPNGRNTATFFNDSTAIAYLKLGATASATSFTVKMQAGDYYELPASYTGVIDCIWASATGAMRITELLA